MKRYLGPFLAGLLVGAAVLLLPIQTVLSEFVVDDAFYYLEIARNIALGNGPTFDGLHLTNGFQPLFQLLLVPIFSITEDPVTGLYLMKGLEAVLLGANCAALFRLADRLSGGNTAAGWLAAGFLLLPGPGWHPFGAALMVGMESGLNALLILLTLLGLEDFLRRRSDWTDRDFLGYGLTLGLLFLARVDNALLIVAILPVMARRVLNEGGNRERRQFVLLLAAAAILAGAYLLWNSIRFGGLLPLSGTIKVFHSARASRELWQQGVGTWLRAGFWFLTELSPLSLLPLTGLLGWAGYLVIGKLWKNSGMAGDRQLVMLLLAGTGVVKVLMYAFRIQMNGFGRNIWYYVPEVVSLCLLVGLVGEAVLRQLTVRWGRLLAIAGVSLAMVGSLIGILRTEPSYEWEAASYQAVVEVQARIPSDIVIGSKDAGVLGYFMPNPVINLDGLVNDEAFFEVIKVGDYRAYIYQEKIKYLVNLVLPEPDSQDFLIAWMGEEQLELIWQDDHPAEGTDGRVYKLYRVKGE